MRFYKENKYVRAFVKIGANKNGKIQVAIKFELSLNPPPPLPLAYQPTYRLNCPSSNDKTLRKLDQKRKYFYKLKLP